MALRRHSSHDNRKIQMYNQKENDNKKFYFVRGRPRLTNNIFKTKCFRLWVGGFDGVSF